MYSSISTAAIRFQDRRRSFQDPPRPTGHPKDSTEQESLMKPYYLDI